ncbi:MAG: CRISPR-associated endonuclease Cas2 [Desulfobacteraceae bacterium 4484_190.1]|nr:MAG: CRISPR-associated endonuclease Cas2 [Desulfobacteraceae bacterium 4484_190.1]
MLVLVTYDVSTETAAGRRRLAKMAKQCKNFGQRVQKSVFECNVDEMHYEKLIRTLVKVMDKEEDSLRIYRLVEPVEKYVKVFGWDKKVDFDKPLVV